MAADDVEFLRWKAERWMKVRHMPAVFTHDPWFVGAHAVQMLRHTFRGSTLRTWLGLEDERAAFERYRALRRQERDYLDQPTVSADDPSRSPRATSTRMTPSAPGSLTRSPTP
jgi:hypothetical protein